MAEQLELFKEAAEKEEEAAEKEKEAAEEEEKAAEKEKEAAGKEEKAAKKEEKADEKKEKRESFWKNLLMGSGRVAYRGAKTASQIQVPSLMLYLILIAVAALDIYLKKSIGYEPNISILISLVVAAVFWITCRGNPFYRSLVLTTLIIDLGLIQLLLRLLPEIGIKETLIALKVFIWLILAIVLFILEFFNHLASGEKPSLFYDLIFIALVAIGIVLLFPQLKEINQLQSSTHSQYWEIAKKELVVAKEEAKKLKFTLGDYFVCLREVNPERTYSQCLKEQAIERECGKLEEEERKACELRLKGIPLIESSLDKTMLKTEVKLEANENFPKIVYSPKVPFPLDFKVFNPKEEKIDLNLNCYFKKGNKIIAGKIEENQWEIAGSQEVSKTVLCLTEEELPEGYYTLVFEGEIKNLKSTATLKRLFVNKETTKKEEEELKKQYFSPAEYKSQAADELVVVSLTMGDHPLNPIIKGSDKVVFLVNLKNNGQGEVTSLNPLEFDLKPMKLGSDCQPLPFEKEFFKQKGSIFPYLACYLELPSQLKEPEKIVVKEFKAVAHYNYKIKKEIGFEMKKII